HRNATATRADPHACVNEARPVPSAQQLLRLRFHLFFFATDERNDVALNIQGSDTGIACARDGLEGHHKYFLQTKSVRQRLQDQHQSGGGTVGIGNDETRAITTILLLLWNSIEMRRVDLGNKQW